MQASMRDGRYLGSNEISWGGVNEWENYEIVYIWHEILHDDKLLGTESDVNHAIIELISDNELRRRLNGDEYNFDQGHHF
jgi:hypothetical protein